MILALVEYSIGGVIPSALDRLVGEAEALRTFVDTFMDYDNGMSTFPDPPIISGSLRSS